MLNDLLAMSVPSSMVDMHLALINSISEILFADQTFTKIYTDGIVSLNGLSEYQKGLNDFFTAFQAIAVYFLNQNITFSSDEGGSIFMPKAQ